MLSRWHRYLRYERLRKATLALSMEHHTLRHCTQDLRVVDTRQPYLLLP